jgi:hypothetical protein
MGKVHTHGLMEEGMRVHISMIKSMDKGGIHGQMEGIMKGNGRMVSSMEKDSILITMEIKALESGNKAEK